MGIPHKHAALIKAWADGAKIQVLSIVHTVSTTASVRVEKEWLDSKNPNWVEDLEYRIKPEPKPDFQMSLVVLPCGIGGYPTISFLSSGNLRLIFDGETRELKKAEVI